MKIIFVLCGILFLCGFSYQIPTIRPITNPYGTGSVLSWQYNQQEEVEDLKNRVNRLERRAKVVDSYIQTSRQLIRKNTRDLENHDHGSNLYGF